MSSPVSPLSAVLAPSAEARRSEKVVQAAHDFESVLVRQLLKATKMGGDSKGGYGDMAVDALADGIEKGGGLGLAQCIEKALGGRAR
jgi:Rod binding domain-containing protein